MGSYEMVNLLPRCDKKKWLFRHYPCLPLAWTWAGFAFAFAWLALALGNN